MTTPNEATEAKCGPSHHGGCACHEAAHAKKVATLEARLAERNRQLVEMVDARTAAAERADARLAAVERERDERDHEAKSINALHDKALEMNEALRKERDDYRAGQSRIETLARRYLDERQQAEVDRDAARGECALAAKRADAAESRLAEAERRAKALETGGRALIDQINRNDFTDSHGHAATMLKALWDLRALIPAVGALAPASTEKPEEIAWVYRCRADRCQNVARHGPEGSAAPVACWQHAGDWPEIRALATPADDVSKHDADKTEPANALDREEWAGFSEEDRVRTMSTVERREHLRRIAEKRKPEPAKAEFAPSLREPSTAELDNPSAGLAPIDSRYLAPPPHPASTDREPEAKAACSCGHPLSKHGRDLGGCAVCHCLVNSDERDAFPGELGCEGKRDGWCCTRPGGHDGEHVARSDRGQVHLRWVDAPKPDAAGRRLWTIRDEADVADVSDEARGEQDGKPEPKVCEGHAHVDHLDVRGGLERRECLPDATGEALMPRKLDALLKEGQELRKAIEPQIRAIQGPRRDAGEARGERSCAHPRLVVRCAACSTDDFVIEDEVNETKRELAETKRERNLLREALAEAPTHEEMERLKAELAEARRVHEMHEADNGRLRKALATLVYYPLIRQHVGTLAHNDGLRALGVKAEEWEKINTLAQPAKGEAT